ncbi:MAG: hypothetical protein AABY83_06175 [Pseudomonadota bacterium]
MFEPASSRHFAKLMLLVCILLTNRSYAKDDTPPHTLPWPTTATAQGIAVYFGQYKLRTPMNFDSVVDTGDSLIFRQADAYIGFAMEGEKVENSPVKTVSNAYAWGQAVFLHKYRNADTGENEVALLQKHYQTQYDITIFQQQQDFAVLLFPKDSASRPGNIFIFSEKDAKKMLNISFSRKNRQEIVALLATLARW